jgi:hypothetical protein
MTISLDYFRKSRKGIPSQAAISTTTTSKQTRRELPRLWHLWTEMVALFATSDQDRAKVDPAAYEVLHGEILEACQTLAPTADEAARKRTEMLTALAAPWLTAASLDQADHEILTNLLVRCRELDQDLSGPSWRTSGRRFRKPLFWAAVVLALVVFFLTAAWTWEPVVDRVLDLWDTVCIVWKRSTIVQRWLAAEMAILALAFWLVVRTSRR